MVPQAADLAVRTLGECRIDSPMVPLLGNGPTTETYVSETDRVLFDDTLSMATQRGLPLESLPGFEPAGPRRKIFFQPSKVRVGIVTCGGICPGLNDVIRGLVLELTHHYQVTKIYGFRNGYQGFIAKYGHPPIDLTPESVSGINEEGGTILGTSRGEQDPYEIVDCLEQMGISVLFVIGGDGSMNGANRIADVVAERGVKISVVGVPKTIDNDIPYIDQSFGFQTAFSKATESIQSAHVEAQAVPHGIGLVHLMGRHSGFIACYASLATNDADYVLIPEVPFALDGPNGFLEHLRRRVLERDHAVVVAAEGAGQEYLAAEPARFDRSGNEKLRDFGQYLRRRINEHFAEHDMDPGVKYIDPSYLIRSLPANPHDSVYCIRLAHAAVHAAMAGRTAMVVGRWRGRLVHVPISLAISKRQQVDPNGDLWMSVLEATGQPRKFT